MNSPRGNGSRMKTVYWMSGVGASDAMLVARGIAEFTLDE